jgi:hypothetical protein
MWNAAVSFTNKQEASKKLRVALSLSTVTTAGLGFK